MLQLALTSKHREKTVLTPYMPCLDTGGWSIVQVLPYFPSGRARQFIVAAEGATPRNRSGVDHVVLILENCLRKAIWRVPMLRSATEGAYGAVLPQSLR